MLVFAVVCFLIVAILVGIYLVKYKKDNLLPVDRVYTIQLNKVSTNMGSRAANHQTKLSSARTTLGAQLNQESAMYIEMVNQQTAAKLAEYENIMSLDRKQREDIMLQAMQRNQLLVIQAANEYRLSPTAYEQMMIESVKLGHQMMLNQNNQSLEIQKHFQMKLIEHQMEELTAGLKKELLTYRQLMPYHQFNELQTMLSVANGTLDSYKRTTFPTQELKDRELKRMEGYIRTLEGKIRDWKKNRLV